MKNKALSTKMGSAFDLPTKLTRNDRPLFAHPFYTMWARMWVVLWAKIRNVGKPHVLLIRKHTI